MQFTNNQTRRQFFKNIGTSCLAMSVPAVLSAGCSNSLSSSQSYLHTFLKPQNNSAVFHWVDIMLQATRNQAFTPPPATRAFAMANVSAFLALNGIYGKYNSPYKIEKAPDNINPEIAYGYAFSMGLSEGMQSSFVFDRQAFLNKYPNGEAKENAIKYARYVANTVLKTRINDGAEPNKANFYLGRYPRRDDNMKWSPTGPFYGGEDGPFLGTLNRGLLPGWGAQKPWVMKRKRAFLANLFIDPASPEFAKQYKRVREIGSHDSQTRTQDETEIAFFWEDGPRGVTPPGHWFLMAIRIIQDRNYSLLEQARLFALLSLATADAAITTWDSKYSHDIVRPETVIRFRTEEFNNPYIKQQNQSNWRSLIFTPDFPAYTSGHSAFGASGARTIANFIGADRVSFSAHGPDLVNWPKQLSGVSRSWTSLWQAAEENGQSRIYGGVHWDVDNTEGLRIGKKLADYVFVNAFERAV